MVEHLHNKRDDLSLNVYHKKVYFFKILLISVNSIRLVKILSLL
jgi:hypothetical protein